MPGMRGNRDARVVERCDPQIVAGVVAFNGHVSYLPFSGTVLPNLADELDVYTMTKSSELRRGLALLAHDESV